MKSMKHMILVLAVVGSAAGLLAVDRNPKLEKIRKAVVRQYDANGNGKLDGKERALILKTHDANGNGQLDRDERLAIARAVAGKQQPKAGAAGGGDQEDSDASRWDTVGLSQANTMGGGKADIPKDGVFRVFVLTYLSDEDLAKARASSGKRKYHKTVLMAHNKAGRDIPNTTTVHHGKLPVEKDGVHFNHEGQVKLGKMTADAVEAFYESKK